MRHLRRAGAVCAMMLTSAAGLAANPGTVPPGWGVDACLTAHVKATDRAAYLDLLKNSGVRVLRERGVQVPADGAVPVESLAGLRQLTAAEFQTVCFAILPPDVAVQQRGNILPEDLLAVHAGGRKLGRLYAGVVTAFELVGEPDLGYCADLPDRLTAFQKAWYLGIKAGARGQRTDDGDLKTESVPLLAAISTGSRPRACRGATNPVSVPAVAGQRNLKPEGPGKLPLTDHRSPLTGNRQVAEPLVLMGALGLPPGPWLERAARNGLFDYTDAGNFHFYGHAKDLTDEVKAHRKFAAQWGRRDLPIWITECGFNVVAPDDFLNPRRRGLQAEFTVSAARQALSVRDVAVFMPFILVDGGDPYAMTLAADKPLPAWEAYAKFTRENSWPPRPLASPPRDPNPMVVQWLPDNRTTIPHKVSGTYRFRSDHPIQGALRVYNFSDHPVSGRLTGSRLKHVRVQLGAAGEERGVNDAGRKRETDPPLQSVSVPAMGMISVPVQFTATTAGYFREFWAGQFVDEGGRRSPVYFGLERGPVTEDFAAVPLPMQPLKDGRIAHPLYSDYTITSQAGPWTGINGLQLKRRSEPFDPAQSRPGGVSGELGGELVAWTEKVENDPLFPPMAVTQLRGLPGQGFLRLTLDRPMNREVKARIDLVDDIGRRFTIWENMGVDYFIPGNEVWLNLEDFHNYSWGRTTGDPKLKARRVRELQVRFYLTKAGEPMGMRLTLLQARRSAQ